MQNNMIQKSRYNQQDGLGHLNIVTGNNYGSTGLFGIGSPGTTNTFPISPSNSNEVLKYYLFFSDNQSIIKHLYCFVGSKITRRIIKL